MERDVGDGRPPQSDCKVLRSLKPCIGQMLRPLSTLMTSSAVGPPEPRVGLCFSFVVTFAAAYYITLLLEHKDTTSVDLHARSPVYVSLHIYSHRLLIDSIVVWARLHEANLLQVPLIIRNLGTHVS